MLEVIQYARLYKKLETSSEVEKFIQNNIKEAGLTINVNQRKLPKINPLYLQFGINLQLAHQEMIITGALGN